MSNIEELINTKFELVNTKLDGLANRMDKINGTVQKHEEGFNLALIERAKNRQVQEDRFKTLETVEKRVGLVEKAEVQHITNCPQAQKVRKLEDQYLSNRSVKKFMATMFIGGMSLGGLVVGLIKLFI